MFDLTLKSENIEFRILPIMAIFHGILASSNIKNSIFSLVRTKLKICPLKNFVLALEHSHQVSIIYLKNLKRR